MFQRGWDPAALPGFALAAEAAGVDDLWVVEDLGWNGGLTAATAALGATGRIRVGLGIAPAPYRNPALFAMEVATIARIHPGRFAAGLGHGVTDWVASIGASVRSPLALLEESIDAVRGLLRGEQVSVAGREVTLDGIQLVHPPEVVPPVLAAAVRERTVELSGRAAQGTVIAEGHGPADVASFRERLVRAGAGEDHELVVFAFCHVSEAGSDETGLGEAEDVDELLSGQASWMGRAPEDLFVVRGTPAEAAEGVRSLYEAGATTVVLRTVSGAPLAQVAAVGQAL